jgi:hypothetical protein
MHRLLAFLVLIPLVGCADLDQTTAPRFGSERAGSGALTILNWNVYYGANLDLLLDESVGPLPVRTATVLGQVFATNTPARAAAVARQIAMAQPHLVTLQEVALYRLQSPGNVLLGTMEPDATVVVDDFLGELMAALTGLGADYVIARQTETLDIEMPIAPVLPGSTGPDCPPCDDVRFTESVVILARADLVFGASTGGTFTYNMPVEVMPSVFVDIVKGWAAVDATLKGRTYRVLTTHLEPADVLPGHAVHPDLHMLQLAQAQEVLAVLASATGPVIVTGDLNTNPDGSSTDTYAYMQASGFVDTWLAGEPAGDGFTANQPWHLTNAVSELWHRIDFVLYRDEFTVAGRPFRGAAQARVVGDKPADRTPGGLWPSDHAGVLVTLNTAQK